jgi:hypothetical protein
MRKPDPDRHLTLPELGQVLGRHRQAIWRWSTQGVQGVVLRTELWRGRRYTTWREFQRFAKALENLGYERMKDITSIS